MGTGALGHKQGTVPGREHHPWAEGYGYSVVTHTELAGRGRGYLTERDI